MIAFPFFESWPSLCIESDNFFVIYLAVMAYFGRGMLLSGNYWEYFSIIGVTLLVIFILRWAMKRREKIREERRKKQDASERRTLRNDNIS